jgi:hypothetical protein
MTPVTKTLGKSEAICLDAETFDRASVHTGTATVRRDSTSHSRCLLARLDLAHRCETVVRRIDVDDLRLR